MLARVTSGSRTERNWLLWSVILALLLLLADQWTKMWFVQNLPETHIIEIIPNWLNFTHVRNFGAAWSMFSGHVWPLLGFSLLVAAGIIIWFRKLTEGCPERYIALLMLISGTLGNAIDRGFRGSVVDFIQVHYHSVWYYPVFNIADMAICCGVGIFLISGLCRKNLSADKDHVECNG